MGILKNKKLNIMNLFKDYQKSIGESTHGGVQKIEPKYTVPQPKNNTQQSSQNNPQPKKNILAPNQVITFND